MAEAIPWSEAAANAIEISMRSRPIKDDEPTVEIIRSECPAFRRFHVGEGGHTLTMSAGAAERILSKLNDTARARGIRYNTDFALRHIDGDGVSHTYSGCYVIGAERGGMIDHVRSIGENTRGCFKLVDLADDVAYYTDRGTIDYAPEAMQFIRWWANYREPY